MRDSGSDVPSSLKILCPIALRTGKAKHAWLKLWTEVESGLAQGFGTPFRLGFQRAGLAKIAPAAMQKEPREATRT